VLIAVLQPVRSVPLATWSTRGRFRSPVRTGPRCSPCRLASRRSGAAGCPPRDACRRGRADSAVQPPLGPSPPCRPRRPRSPIQSAPSGQRRG
jgi:hypothetical protein